jgi:hypothetical protein
MLIRNICYVYLNASISMHERNVLLNECRLIGITYDTVSVTLGLPSLHVQS